MSKILQIVCLLLLGLAFPFPALAGNNTGCSMNDTAIKTAASQLQAHDAVGISLFRANADCFTWPYYYLASSILFESGFKNEAVFWFYAGQLRGRIAASFDPDHDRSRTLLSAMNAQIGSAINQYAGGDLKNWIAIIDKVLLWDKEHKLRPDSEDITSVHPGNIDLHKLNEVYAGILSGLNKMRADLAAKDPVAWNAQRRANGLSD